MDENPLNHSAWLRRDHEEGRGPPACEDRLVNIRAQDWVALALNIFREACVAPLGYTINYRLSPISLHCCSELMTADCWWQSLVLLRVYDLNALTAIS